MTEVEPPEAVKLGKEESRGSNLGANSAGIRRESEEKAAVAKRKDAGSVSPDPRLSADGLDASAL